MTDQWNPEAFAEHLRFALYEHNIPNNSQLAARMGVDRSVLTGILSYKRQPSMQVVQKLAAALGEDPVKWLVLAGYEWVTQPPTAPPQTGNNVIEIDGHTVHLRTKHGGPISQESIEAIRRILREEDERHSKTD